MEDSFVFASVLSDDEWQSIPEDLGKKMVKFVTENFDDLIKSKALLETKCYNLEKDYKTGKDMLETSELEVKSHKSKLEVAKNTIEEHEAQLSNLNAEINKLHTQFNTLQAETAEYRQQRNQAVDEKDEHLRMINRRNGEIERLQADLNTLTKQLDSAVNAKCEALAQVDEVASMKLNIEYREKRIEQERALLTSQVESLTQEINQRTEELLNMRRDNTSLCIQLESKLTQKTQELTVATEQIKSLTDLNNNLTVKIEELSQKMVKQREDDAKMSESYVYEIDAKTKMANAYKSMFGEAQQHNEELKEALSEVQQLLKTATDQYGELETKHKETVLANEEIISKKNECIELLKKELETANELIEHSRPALDGDNMSPNTSASKLVKSGMSYSEMYSRYVGVSDKLTNKEEECARLNNYIEAIVREMEGNFPKLRKLHEDYSDSLSAIDALKESNEQLLNEVQQLRDANAECKKAEGIQSRENERLKREVSDLSRQVVVLLQEVENSRVGSSSTSTDNDMSDSINSADIISKKLVTFNDISELQNNNLKLLALVRELSERQEEVESLDPAAIAGLKVKLEELNQSQNELLEERDRQTKMMATLRNQKDMYKNLYMQVVKTTGEDIHMSDVSENGEPKIRTETETQLEEKVHEFEAQVEKLTKQVEHLKEENETYRKEKSANEKILLEQLENMRGEVKELTRLNCKLSSHADLNEEKFKIFHNNIEIYKKQITALEKQNKIYSESIIKHEQAATYLKDETIQCQTKLSKAEVILGNLQKENALLKDAERRLLKERDALKRDSHQQNLIKSNIELIKATLERTDAEGKLRLEARLDEAHRECAALRRRLQEEQDHFRQLSDQLSKQNKDIQKRNEEERGIAEKLRKEVAEVREELMSKVQQNEELSKKLKSGLFIVPDSSAETRRVRELEQQVADLQAEIESLKKKLKTAKEASDEYFSVAEASEKQVKDAMDQNESLIKELDKHKARVKDLEEKCAELEGELSIQLDDQDISNANIKSKSTQLQEELNIRNMDLKTAKEQLETARSENKQLIEQLKAVENKYAREVTLHSVDLQSLTIMKEELEKALGDINALDAEKQAAIAGLEQFKQDWEKQENIINNEKRELESRFNDVDSQNSLLHDQIQALNTQLSILQAQVTDPQSQNLSMGDSSFNRSFTEDEVKSSEQLLKIIKYLRQEKDIAVSKADIVEAEHSRLKSQFDMLNKQLEEAKAAIETERQKTEISVVSAAKHSEVLRKLETLNAITDSNRALRQERDTLAAQIAELRSRSEMFETEVEPLQEKNRELTTKADQLQSENISLRAECTRWRQRANMLIEKTNRTSPEDWKKLQTERETLAKQLTIERANVTKLNDDINNLKQDKSKLEDQLRILRGQNNQQQEELNRLREEVSNLQAQVTQLTNNVDQQSVEIIKFREENRVLTEDTASKDVAITELKNNLAQIRKIAKKYKIQCEDQTKEIDSLKQQNQTQESVNVSNAEKQELLENQRSELEEKINRLESTHKDAIDQLNQEVSSTTEQIESYKREIETLKQTSQEKEERFKTLFKNAKERIVSLTEQNNTLKEEVNRPARSDGGEQSNQDSARITELLEKIAALERERDEILEEKQQELDKHTTEVESLNQRISQLQRQLGLQQGSKPSTSSSTTEKSSTERPTADIKPMAGHSTNTQTQSVPIQPWRSGGEPPLASIRPMSAQLRTVAVLPTSQSPSAVMVPPQQQVHTTGSSSIEALSSSPTSSHTEYVPATSSASPAMLGPRQVAVPPTQSSQDTEDDESSMQVQAAPQTQAVALVLPRVEPPSSGPTQEQGTSSSSSNTVTTTQAGHKRQREADMDSCQSDEQTKTQQQVKRTRVQQTGTVSDSGLDVEYQVPTSSQRDHDDDNVIVVESDEEGGADEGEGADDEQDDPDTEGYDIGMEQDNYEDADCQDVEDEEEAGNEVEVIDDSSEVPNQSERSEQDNAEEENSEQPQSEAISSGTDGTGRSVPTTPLQSSPQEGIPGGEEQSTSQMTQSDAEIPSIAISGEVDDNETGGEGSSGDMGPPGVAGTSDGAQQLEQSEEMLEGDDGVSSEGEKPPLAEEGEEEGREAEASPSTNSRRIVRGTNSARRSVRTSMPRGHQQRSGPTPIVWGDRSPQRHQHMQDRGRGSPTGNYQARTVARRARGRIQRPFGNRF